VKWHPNHSYLVEVRSCHRTSWRHRAPRKRTRLNRENARDFVRIAASHIHSKKLKLSPMLTIRVRPRLEINKWSLYHNSTLSTKTIILDEIVLSLSAQKTVQELSRTSWHQIYDQEAQTELKSDLTTEDRVLCNGTQLMADKRLEEYRIPHAADLVVIRRLFVVEGTQHHCFRWNEHKSIA
jgi:hypothetical protein